MIPPLHRLIHYLRFWLRAEALDISIAILPAIFLVTFSATNEQGPIVPGVAPALQAAPPAVNEVQIEQHPEPAVDSPRGKPSEEEHPHSTEDHANAEVANSQGSPGSLSKSAQPMEVIDQYLWGVYQRSPVKRDSSGDFTWKDLAAAERLGMSLADYVIGGMDRDLRELLYRAGLAMDAAGYHWTILSGFRDDYRQGLASGYKARTDNSLHGGSAATGGYGHGCAVDITDVDGNSDPLWKWLDANSAQLGLQRLLPGVDPAHVQPRGAWHELALALRKDRLANNIEVADRESAAGRLNTTGAPSEADYACNSLRRRQDDTSQALATNPPVLRGFRAARAHRPGTPLIATARWRPRSGIGSAALALASRKSKSERVLADTHGDSAKPPLHMKATAKLASRHASRGGPHGRSTI